MRIIDWSSDVCSSDLRKGVVGRQQTVARLGQFPPADESDAAIDEMAWALSSPAVAEHFGNLAGAERPSAGWLRHLQRAGTLGKEPTSSHGVPLVRSEEHTSELQSLMRISYAVFCLKKKKQTNR